MMTIKEEAEFNKNLAKGLKSFRESQQIKQIEFSEKFSINQTILSKIENGKIKLSAFMLYKLETWYGIGATELVQLGLDN